MPLNTTPSPHPQSPPAHRRRSRSRRSPPGKRSCAEADLAATTHPNPEQRWWLLSTVADVVALLGAWLQPATDHLARIRWTLWRQDHRARAQISPPNDEVNDPRPPTRPRRHSNPTLIRSCSPVPGRAPDWAYSGPCDEEVGLGEAGAAPADGNGGPYRPTTRTGRLVPAGHEESWALNPCPTGDHTLAVNYPIGQRKYLLSG